MQYTEKEFYHDIIDSMIIALESRDLYTAGHSERVSNMAYMMCELLGLDESSKEIIHIAAHLHDIGKIGIQDAILNKKEKLTDEEWTLLEKHSEIGYNILSKSKLLKEVAQIVLCHHERWDGKGYPNMLKDEAIPYGSRIIAICDSIDAMKIDRPYRKALDNDTCKEEIKKNIGIMYDPTLAQCTIENWDIILKDTYK